MATSGDFLMATDKSNSGRPGRPPRSAVGAADGIRGQRGSRRQRKVSRVHSIEPRLTALDVKTAAGIDRYLRACVQVPVDRPHSHRGHLTQMSDAGSRPLTRTLTTLNRHGWCGGRGPMRPQDLPFTVYTLVEPAQRPG
jgi:hypothetical protein